MAYDGVDYPLGEELIGRLYASNKRDINEVVSGLPENTRGRLALFCYERAHLRDAGLAIAATCTLDSLVAIGGRVGQFVFDLSREAPTLETLSGWRRQKITLATTEPH